MLFADVTPDVTRDVTRRIATQMKLHEIWLVKQPVAVRIENWNDFCICNRGWWKDIEEYVLCSPTHPCNAKHGIPYVMKNAQLECMWLRFLPILRRHVRQIQAFWDGKLREFPWPEKITYSIPHVPSRAISWRYGRIIFHYRHHVHCIPWFYISRIVVQAMNIPKL